ncbi:hypothetical protein AHAS_Ahas19G0143200 [Arachis hypogaea]
MEHVMKLKDNLIEWKILKHDNNNNNNNNNNNSIQGQVNSTYYQPMIDVITNMGAGYKSPNFGRVCGYLLSKLVEDVKKMIERTIFLKSVDASHASKTADLLFKLFKDVVLFVSPENVVHTMTDNDANYVATRSSNSLCYQFHSFAILAQKDALRNMVTSKEYRISAYSKEAKAKTFVDQVLDSKFWNQCTDIVKLTEPLVRVLRIVNSEDKAAMGFIYQAFYKAREEMVKRFQRRKKIVEPYLKILDTHWDSQLHKNLHVAGYWLNPAFRFNADEFEKYKQTTSGLLDVIEKYAYGELELNSKLTSEIRIYKNAEDDFRRQSALRQRSTVMLDQLNLEDDQDNDGPNNNAMEDIDANQNEKMLIKLQICPMKILILTLSSSLGLDLPIVLSFACPC